MNLSRKSLPESLLRLLQMKMYIAHLNAALLKSLALLEVHFALVVPEMIKSQRTFASTQLTT